MPAKNKTMVNPLNESLANLTRNVVKETEPVKKSSTAKTTPKIAVQGSSKKGWDAFMEYADMYNKQEGKTRGDTVWIDEDIKKALDKIKGACKVPTRHIVSAALRVFIEEYKGDIKDAIEREQGDGLL